MMPESLYAAAGFSVLIGFCRYTNYLDFCWIVQNIWIFAGLCRISGFLLFSCRIPRFLLDRAKDRIFAVFMQNNWIFAGSRKRPGFCYEYHAKSIIIWF
jgi:hypothetical protein